MGSLEGDDLNHHSYGCLILSCSCIYECMMQVCQRRRNYRTEYIGSSTKVLTRFGTKLRDNLGIDNIICKVISHIGCSDYCVFNENPC